MSRMLASCNQLSCFTFMILLKSKMVCCGPAYEECETKGRQYSHNSSHSDNTVSYTLQGENVYRPGKAVGQLA